VSDLQRLSEGDLLRIPILLILATFYGAAAETGRRMHQRAERILVESEVKFRSVVETAHEAIILTDAGGHIVSWNKAAQHTFGYDPAEIQGQSLKILVPERFREMWGLEWFHAQGGSELIGSTVEFQGLRKDGTEFPCELSLATWTTEDGPFFSAIIRDISERKRMEEWVYRKEEQLRQAQKMEAIGRLASQVAHDFNHVLFVIMSCSQLLLRRSAPDDPAKTKLEEIQKAADRGQTLTQQLLNYGRKQPRKPGKVSPNSIITDLIPMLERLVGKPITIRAELAPALGMVVADTSQLEQVIVNLATNARDAMRKGGTLTIQTRIVGPEEAGLSENVSGAVSAVLIAVSDNGSGMDAETKAHCLEPFFTTKSVGQGTGLGLATVADIVQQSGGRIDIDSEPGRGTTVRLYLPHVESPAAAAPIARPSNPGMARTILVVDDDGHARRAMFEILQHHGYHVLEGTSGTHALALAAQHPDAIDLLLTDVVMPEMNGRDLAARLKEIRPGLKVIFVSGYSPDLISNYGVLNSGSLLLQKPFTPEALASKVRSVIEAR
jgi:PAS domain S-box-containing protein